MGKLYKKFLKWVIIVLAVPAFVVGLLTYRKWQSLQSAREKSIGVYIVSLDKSNVQLLKEDSLQLIGLKLTLKRDGTFNLSHSVPYLSDTHGTWEVDGYGMDRFINIKMPTGSIHQMDTCCSRDSTISIAYPAFDDNSYGWLAFEKL
jgi:hypothetical protein